MWQNRGFMVYVDLYTADLPKKPISLLMFFPQAIVHIKSLDHDFLIRVKCTIIWINRGWRSVYFILYAAYFPKSTGKYFKFGTIQWYTNYYTKKKRYFFFLFSCNLLHMNKNLPSNLYSAKKNAFYFNT